MDFNFNYVLPKKSRKGVSKPAGDFLEGGIETNIKIAHEWFKNHTSRDEDRYQVICVGDVVSEAFLKDSVLNTHLKMCVVDGKTKRDVYNIDPGAILPNHIQLENPSGMISGKTSKKIKELIETGDKFFVEIDGEEDLLVIPIVLFSEDNTFVVYGQPPITDLGKKIPAGMVIISVNPIFRDRMGKTLEFFIKQKI